MSAATDFSIKHSIPGRLRVIFPALVSQKDLTRNLETNLSNTPGINRVQSNHFCGSVTIKYNPEIVEIVDIIKENSICRTDMFIEKNINNESGELNIACIMPNFSTGIKKGLVAKLVLQPKKEGSFMLDFTEDSQVLANDGLGTDVLRTAIGGFYIVENFLKESKQLMSVQREFLLVNV